MKDLKTIYLKYKLLIWPVLTGLSSLVILSLVVIPQILGYIETRGKINDIESRSDKMEVKAKGLEGIDPSVSSENLKVAFTVLPADRNVPSAVSILQALITQSGLTLKNTSYSSVAKGTSKDSFMLNVTVIGQINNVRRFLIGLKDAGRVFQVESINVRFQKSGSLVEAEIPITVFFSSGKAAAGASDQEAPKLSEKDEQLLSNLSNIVRSPLNLAASGESTTSSVPIGKANPFE